MRKLLILFMVVMTAALFAQGESHNIFGSLENSGGTPVNPECITIRAYLAGSPGHYLTEDSTGCEISAGGLWAVNVGNLGAADGDTLVIVFIDDCTGESLEIRGAIDLETSSEEFWGLFTMEPGTFTDIQVDQPNGGEEYEFGDPVIIQWTTWGTITHVHIEYSLNGGTTWMNVIADTPNDGDHIWAAPSSATEEALIKITALDDPSHWDVSNAFFTIVEPVLPRSISLFYPTGGETFYWDESITIRWESTGPIFGVDLFFSDNNGISWTPLGSDLVPDGTFVWPIPDVERDHCLIRVEDRDDPAMFDQNAPVFVITEDDLPPYIELIYPEGGETFYWDETIDIEWAAEEIVDLLFSADNGGSWTTLAEGLAATGTFNWAIPDIESDHCLVRVQESHNHAIFDQNTPVFTITEDDLPPAIELIYPAGAETFYWDETIDIEWEAEDLVDLLFSDNNGTSWTTLAEGLAATGTFNWPIPDIESDQCLVRVQEADDAGVFDQNAPTFTITETDDPGDTIPPANITDLTSLVTEYTRTHLQWTAPGDDHMVGTAAQYDLRFLPVPITDANWAGAIPISGEPAPLSPGTRQDMWVNGLTPGRVYYAAIKTADEVPNWSGLSNLAEFETPPLPDSIPPDPITLGVTGYDCNYIELEWLASGDNRTVGTADHYDFRWSNEPITTENWADAESVSTEPVPASPRTRQTLYLGGLEELTEYYIGAIVYDEADNGSVLSNIIHVSTPLCIDTIAPGAVLDMHCIDIGTDFITLTWTAPGDDRYEGFASRYEIYWDTETTLTMFNYYHHPLWPTAPEPVEGGEPQVYTMEGLEPATLHYVAVMTYDEVGHLSEFGRVAACMTSGVIDPIEDVVKYEDDPDFYLPYLDEIFLLAPDFEFSYRSTAPQVRLTLEDDDLLDAMSPRLLVSLAPDYFGESWIIIKAWDDHDTLVDSIHVTVLPVDDAPRFLSGAPDSMLVEGYPLSYETVAYDIEGDSIIYLLVESPLSASIDAEGNLYWDPEDSDGRFLFTIGLTNEGCPDTALITFYINVIKLTHPVFKPRNLLAHDGYRGSIPCTWEVPLAVEMGLPVVLVGYNLQRSNSFEFGYETIASDLIYNSWNDCYVEYERTYYYRVQAIYSTPDDVSGFSNIDAGYAMESNKLYSNYVREYPIIDGVLDDDIWDNATVIWDFYDGIDLYLGNAGTVLFMAIAIEGGSAADGEFNFFFDDNWNLAWPESTATEGRFTTYDRAGAGEFFRSYMDDGGLVIGDAVLAPTFTAEWSTSSGTVVEMMFDMADDDPLFGRPGDTIGTALTMFGGGGGTIFEFPLGVDTSDPEMFGEIVLGSPGVGSPVLVENPIFVTIDVEADWFTDAHLEIQNVGMGVGVVDGIGEDAAWLTVTPTSSVIFPHTRQMFTLNVDAEGLTPGTYETAITFWTNDPERPEFDVPVYLNVYDHDEAHYFKVFPPYRTDGDPGDFVDIPITTGRTYGNDIFRLDFAVEVETDVAVTNGVTADLPEGWFMEVVNMEDHRLELTVEGVTPLPDSTVLATIRYAIPDLAMMGNSCYIKVVDLVINEGVELPVPVMGQGIIVVGEDLLFSWIANLIYIGESGTYLDSLFFGTLPYATGQYDRGIDRLNIPALPGMADAYFISDDFRELRKDIRHFGDTLIVWKAVIDGRDGWLKWNPNRIWSGCYIEDEIDMTADSIYHVSDGDTVWFYYHHNFEVDWTVDLKRGWNLISVPIHLDDPSVATLFPTALPPAYAYNSLIGLYQSVFELNPGPGYWVLIPEDTTYTLSGSPIYSYELDLTDRWNMIGAVYRPVDFWEQRVIPEDGLLEGDLWGYQPEDFRYYRAEALEPGLGYWVFSFGLSEIHVSTLHLGKASPGMDIDPSSCLMLDIGGSQQVELRTMAGEGDISMMPPLVPGETSRIQIKGGYSRMDMPLSGGSWTVEVTADTPAHLNWVANGSIDYILELNGQEIALGNRGGLDLPTGTSLLKVTAEVRDLLPTLSAIDGISPNPANSAFKIDWNMAEAGNVELVLESVDGRRIATLSTGNRDAGNYTSYYTPSDLGTGVYLLRLTTPAGTSTEKLILMK